LKDERRRGRPTTEPGTPHISYAYDRAIRSPSPTTFRQIPME